MKKSFFSFLTLMAMGCMCFTSCNKNSDKEPDPTPTEPETPVEVNFVTAIVPEQLKYMEQTFEMDVNGKTVSFSLSQMNKVADKSKYPAFKVDVDKAVTFMDGLVKVTEKYDMYDYKLGTLTSGQSVTAKSLTFKVLESRPKNDSLSYLQAWNVCDMSGKAPTNMLGVEQVTFHKGIMTDDGSISKFIGLMSKNFSFTATYNKK